MPNDHRSARPLAALALVLTAFAAGCSSTEPGEPDPEQQLQLHREFALRYFDQGDLNRAEQQVDKALEIEPEDQQLLLMKGWVRQRRGTAQDILVAEKIFRDLVTTEDYRVDLGLGEALERKGVLYTEAADAVASGDRFTEHPDPQERARELRQIGEDSWTESTTCYERALQRKPGEFQAMNGLQRVLALRGDVEGSLRWADELLAGSRAEMDFWRERLRRPELGADEERRLRDLLDGSLRLQVETHLAAATLLLTLDRTAEAVAHLDEAAALAPERPRIHSRRAQLLMQLDRPGEAALALQEFLRLSELPYDHADVRRAYAMLAECETAARLEASAGN